MRTVLVNGIFDGLHTGHKYLLSQAREMGDLVVIAVNTDFSARELKGEGRPIHPIEERLKAITTFVPDAMVQVFGTHGELERIIRYYCPEIIVKGSDYRPDDVFGKDIVAEWGGEVRILQRLPNHSTTELLCRP